MSLPESQEIKVLHITTVDTSLRYLLLNQLISLQNEGYVIATASSPGVDAITLESRGIQHFSVPIAREIAPLKDLRSLWQLFRLIRTERFSVVHTHNPKPGLLGQVAAKLAGTPIIVNTLHGYYFHENMNKWTRKFYISLERLAAICSDVILSQNREDMQTAIDERICQPKKIQYLGNGIDIRQFDATRFSIKETLYRKNEIGIAADSPVVGFVGRLAAKRKGFLDFLEAAQRIISEYPRVRFLIIGEADHGKSDAVEPELAEYYGISDQCYFLGQLPNEDLPMLYRLMDVLVLPSLFEGMPRAIMEAAAMSVPVVATDVKGNREAVVHNSTGFLVPYGDVAALSDAILRILNNEKIAVDFRSASRDYAEKHFDELLVFEKVKAVYANLFCSKGLLASELTDDRSQLPNR